MAIARGPLDQVGALYIEQQPGREARGSAPQTGSYAVPDSILFADRECDLCAQMNWF